MLPNESFYSLSDAFQQSNAAGMLNRLRLIPLTYVENILRPNLDELILPVDAIKVKSAVDVIIDIQSAHDSIRLTESMQNGIHGRSYTVQLIAELPKNRVKLTTWFHKNINREFLAITKDREGNVKLIGTKEQPLIFTGFVASVGNRTGKNMAAIELSADVVELAKYIDAADEIFDFIAIQNLDDVLLSAIKSGKLAIQFKEVSLLVNAENQTEFIIPDSLIDKTILSFSVNHIPYSLGIEYNILLENKTKKIIWSAVDFPIALTDLVQIKYLEILNIF